MYNYKYNLTIINKDNFNISNFPLKGSTVKSNNHISLLQEPKLI